MAGLPVSLLPLAPPRLPSCVWCACEPAFPGLLARRPRVLILDEPLEGLAPIIVEELIATIRAMAKDEGMALILVEQHAEVALDLTDDAVVIERGVIAHAAPSQELLKDQATLDRYVGLNLED